MTLNIEKGFGVGHSAETFSNWDSFWFPFQPLLSSWCDLWVSSAIVSLVTASHYVLRQRIQVLYAFKKTSKLTVTSKHRSWEGDWNLERKDCSSCPTCPPLSSAVTAWGKDHHSVARLRSLSWFLLFCRINQISHWLHTGNRYIDDNDDDNGGGDVGEVFATAVLLLQPAIMSGGDHTVASDELHHFVQCSCWS